MIAYTFTDAQAHEIASQIREASKHTLVDDDFTVVMSSLGDDWELELETHGCTTIEIGKVQSATGLPVTITVYDDDITATKL